MPRNTPRAPGKFLAHVLLTVYASTSDLDTGHPSGGRQLNVHRIYSYQPYLKPPAPLRIQPLTSVWVATPGPLNSLRQPGLALVVIFGVPRGAWVPRRSAC